MMHDCKASTVHYIIITLSRKTYIDLAIVLYLIHVFDRRKVTEFVIP